MSGYFQNFPIVRYGNTYARNITARIAFNEEVVKQSYVYYPYEMQSEMRPDTVAHYYYNDSFSDWVFIVGNTIIDPYYQWYQSNENLNNSIDKKYGSVLSAATGIHHWKVNWLGDDRIITTSEYGALTVNFTTGENLKKYWVPLYNDQGMVTGYKRKALDVEVETNKVVSLDITFSSGNTFTTGERVYQSVGSTVTAYAFVKFSNTTTLTVKNVVGTLSNTYNVIGESSNSVASFTTANTIARSFPESESSYWSYVSNYDYEIEENEKRRTINVVDKRYITDVNNALREKLADE